MWCPSSKQLQTWLLDWNAHVGIADCRPYHMQHSSGKLTLYGHNRNGPITKTTLHLPILPIFIVLIRFSWLISVVLNIYPLVLTRSWVLLHSFCSCLKNKCLDDCSTEPIFPCIENILPLSCMRRVGDRFPGHIAFPLEKQIWPPFKTQWWLRTLFSFSKYNAWVQLTRRNWPTNWK